MEYLSLGEVAKWRSMYPAVSVLACVLLGLTAPVVQAQQVGTSISADGAAPNVNAMLDVQSPATGDGKGLLIPRITDNQRTNASAVLAGGLLDNSGELRGGAAMGLMVYQTDGTKGVYYNTSATPTPAWSYVGDTADLPGLQSDVAFISNNYVRVKPANRTFGISAVAQNGSGTVFTHPATNMYLTWSYSGGQTSGVLSVTNRCWFWLDASITMIPEHDSSPSRHAANDLNINAALSVTNHGYSGGWSAMAIKEDNTGPGFQFEGCQYANGINGIVIYWY